MTAVAAIVGFIFAKAPLGASPPPARPAPVTAAAPVHADIAPLPAAVCLGVSCPAAAPQPTIAPTPAPAPTILPTLATAPALSPAPAVAADAEPSTLPASAATKTLFARRAHAARREDHDESTRRVSETRGPTQPFDDASLDNKRPASLRTIDESDPFK